MSKSPFELYIEMLHEWQKMFLLYGDISRGSAQTTLYDLPSRKRSLLDDSHSLRCSFCHKLAREVCVLIAGPDDLFICDECVGVTSDVVQEREGLSKIRRILKFAPEHRQAGMAILDYFSKYLNDRYPDVQALVRIEQEQSTVRMCIETPEGTRETVERTLEEFAQVVTGKSNPGDLIEDPIKLMELRYQLDICAMQLKWAEEQKQILLQHNRVLSESHKLQADNLKDLNRTLQIGLTNMESLALSLRDLSSRSDTDDFTQIALNRLIDAVESGVEPSDKQAVVPYLENIKRSHPESLKELYDICKQTTRNVTTNLLTSWIKSML